MLRKPRNARTGRLTDWKFFFQIYLVREQVRPFRRHNSWLWISSWAWWCGPALCLCGSCICTSKASNSTTSCLFMTNGPMGGRATALTSWLTSLVSGNASSASFHLIIDVYWRGPIATLPWFSCNTAGSSQCATVAYRFYNRTLYGAHAVIMLCPLGWLRQCLLPSWTFTELGFSASSLLRQFLQCSGAYHFPSPLAFFAWMKRVNWSSGPTRRWAYTFLKFWVPVSNSYVLQSIIAKIAWWFASPLCYPQNWGTLHVYALYLADFTQEPYICRIVVYSPST